ncbi:hypothetical protein MCHI_000683 [Candidatus Magnetoovum chiemensis]|nr:hypothetical protein MCHI_000683 [Candidatus Magnetoovum chiemensis]
MVICRYFYYITPTLHFIIVHPEFICPFRYQKFSLSSSISFH